MNVLGLREIQRELVPSSDAIGRDGTREIERSIAMGDRRLARNAQDLAHFARNVLNQCILVVQKKHNHVGIH